MGKRIVVQIRFEDCHVEGDSLGEAAKDAEGTFSIELPESLEFDIDACEEAVMKANYPALRDALQSHLTHISRKKAEAAAPLLQKTCANQVKVIQRNVPYRVDSEIGRFTFDTHEVRVDDWIGYCTTTFLPTIKGKGYYLTRGFREIAFLLGTTESSYRKTVERLNRQRYQTQGGTPLNTGAIKQKQKDSVSFISGMNKVSRSFQKMDYPSTNRQLKMRPRPTWRLIRAGH